MTTVFMLGTAKYPILTLANLASQCSLLVTVFKAVANHGPHKELHLYATLDNSVH